jgi:hypothetical protein
LFEILPKCGDGLGWIFWHTTRCVTHIRPRSELHNKIKWRQARHERHEENGIGLYWACMHTRKIVPAEARHG